MVFLLSLYWYIGCTLRSRLNEIPTMIRTFPRRLENNHACKWISDNFPGITDKSAFLENFQKSTLKDPLPWIGEQQYIQMDF